MTILLIGLHPCGAFLKKGEGNAGFYPMMAEGGSAPATTPIEASNRVALRLSPPDRPPAAGVVLVKLRKGSETADAWRNALSSTNGALLQAAKDSGLGQAIASFGVEFVEPAFRVARLEAASGKSGPAGLPTAREDTSKIKREDLFRWYKLRLADRNVSAALACLRTNRDVEMVERNAGRRLTQVFPFEGLPDGTTDPDIGLQWHHTAVRLPNGWNYLKETGLDMGGNHAVIIAVLDTGVDATHEELVGNVWTNGGEIPGNGIDDDHNGFVDDVHGCSVVSDARSHSGDSSDYHGHGTHVAGIAVAQAFNHHGGVGAAFNVQVMSVRTADYSGVLTALDASEAVLYAVDNGAEVINMSFGGYTHSQIEEDALAVALSRAVLVAAAGNDGLNGFEYPHYPAALPFVHGVMASTTKGKRAWFSNYGYDLAAPGESIYSTLPGNRYAAWSGTSMSTPIVSGIAALLRSYYWQRDIYSSRFLMGALWASSTPIVDAYSALTVLPKPGVSLLNRWLFDSASISPRNDADGRVDAGETLHLAIEVINRSGQANNVHSTLRARAQSAVQDDPYVTIATNVASFGSIGPWNTADNGFLYDTNGVIVGVASPLVFSVSSNCPNDHVIPFELTTTAEDGWDPAHGTVTRVDYFNYIVQRGRNVPSVISSNVTLTADQYWIVGGPCLVEAGARLAIEPGTQVQWGAVSDDPYNSGPHSGYIVVRGTLDAQGTVTNPISLFPSYLVSGQTTAISVESGGVANLGYANVRNPNLTGFHLIDHADFVWDMFGSNIRADRISNSLFHKLRGGGTLSAEYSFETCLFDASWLGPSPAYARLLNCVFLQDNENIHPLQFNVPWSFTEKLSNERTYAAPALFYQVTNYNGDTYAVLPMELGETRLAECIANFYGGHVTSIRDQADQDFLIGWLAGLPPLTDQYAAFMIGLTDEGTPGQYRWLDGSPLTYTNWKTGQPAALPWTKHPMVAGMEQTAWGGYQKVWGWAVSPETSSTRAGAQPRWWYFYLLRLPGSWTMEQLTAPYDNGQMLSYVRAHFPGDVRYNAFLNKYWDPNINTWMRFIAPSGANSYCAMRDNYWGTDSSTLLDYAIVDYYDNFTSARVDYGTLSAHGFESTFPFVDELWINGVPADNVPALETGPATFTLMFNRPMNTNVEPFVTFGPSYPFTDFQVLPRDTNFIATTNGWLDSRTWQGQAYITPVTGNGYHQMRMSGAVDAADPWLVTGYDVGRFRFRVQTVGVASMALQASGGEGRIDLNWAQNDYDLVAGYNIYRAPSADGPFTRLNSLVLSPQVTTYTDLDVLPAVPMFYRFTVVTTDFQESEPSGIASASAYDTIPPVLVHVPITTAPPGRSIRLAANASDNVQVSTVALFYRASGTSNSFAQVQMLNLSGTEWSATIPASAALPPGLEYYLVASDGITQVFSGTAVTPHQIVINNVPGLSAVTPNHGTTAGGTAVTLTGVQFQPGAGVLFGGVPASAVNVLSSSQITCVTPQHFPAAVDVQVANTNGTQATLLGGFTYESTGTVIALPDVSGDYGAVVEVSLSAANLSGLRAADLALTYGPSVLRLTGARSGSVITGWSFTANTNTPGLIILSMAGATSVSGAGPLAVLTFNPIAPPPASSPLAVTNALLNDGAIAAELVSGSFTVNGFWDISGAVHYYTGTALVQNVTLSLNGSGAYSALSGSDGAFTLTNLPGGSYDLVPSKIDQVNGITAYDASLVLQAAAGLLNLTPNQVKAADVNRNGFVSSFDAAYILERAVALLEVPFPNAGRVWDFIPSIRSYNPLSANQSGQDFSAVLLGDVSGNWTPDASGQGINDGGEDPPQVVLATDTGMVRTNKSTYRLFAKATAPGLYSLDLTLHYNAAVSTVQSVDAGPLAGNLLLVANTNEPGVILAALASATPITGDGVMLSVTMNNAANCDLQIARASIDEGAVPVSIDTSSQTFDSDLDGLADTDERAIFNTDPFNRDTDGDRMSDGDEVRAGTDPNNALSVLRLLSAVSSPAGCTITWSSVSGKSYQVEVSDHLGQAWQALGAPVRAQGVQASLTDSPSGQTRFYRIKLAE